MRPVLPPWQPGLAPKRLRCLLLSKARHTGPMAHPPAAPVPPPRRPRRAVGAVLGVLACTAALVWWAGTRQEGGPQALRAHLPTLSDMAAWLRQPDLATLPGLPRHWNPWAPLTLQEPDGPLTRWKLDRLEASPAACLQWLADAPGIASTPLPDRIAGSAANAGQCGWRAGSRISGMGQARFSSPFVLACGAAVALARWEHHVLQPAARAQLGAPVARIEHLGSYACRRIAGSAGPGRLSEHASANALDVSAFVLQGGTRISVLGDWQAEDPAPVPAPVPTPVPAKSTGAPVQASQGAASGTPVRPPGANGQQMAPPLAAPRRPALPANPKAAFLRQVRDGACHGFSAVLGPDYNAAHRDHFHFDRGPYRVCR